MGKSINILELLLKTEKQIKDAEDLEQRFRSLTKNTKANPAAQSSCFELT
jgi:hypothetical protein